MNDVNWQKPFDWTDQGSGTWHWRWSGSNGQPEKPYIEWQATQGELSKEKGQKNLPQITTQETKNWSM